MHAAAEASNECGWFVAFWSFLLAGDKFRCVADMQSQVAVDSKCGIKCFYAD